MMAEEPLKKFVLDEKHRVLQVILDYHCLTLLLAQASICMLLFPFLYSCTLCPAQLCFKTFTVSHG